MNGEATREYRVVWKREGCRRKARVFKRQTTAARFVRLFGPEPWTAYLDRRRQRGPDDLACCDGRECACGGLTVREQSDEQRKRQPALEYLRVETRDVGAWVTS